MEFNNIKINGSETTVIFNGARYFFYDNFFGLVCMAERDAENENLFHISAGNDHTIGSRFHSAIMPAVKRFITRSENKYISKKVSFEETGKDLANRYISIDLKSY